MKHCPSRLLALPLLLLAGSCVKHDGDIALVPPTSPPVFVTRLEVATGTDLHADYVVADFDGDDNLDMAVISLSGELRVLFGNGGREFGGSFGEQAEQIDGVPAWIDSGDFDNDGDLDLAIVRSDEDTTEVWRNDSGVFAMALTLPVGENALALEVGDLDQDGELDIAVSRPLAPEILVAFGQPGLAFSQLQAISLPGGGRPLNLEIGDADRDGQDDLVVVDRNNARILLYPGAPQAVFGNEVCQLDVSGTPGAVALGDLSGDGNADLVVSIFDGNKYLVITDLIQLAGKGGKGGGVSLCSYLSFDVPMPGRPSLATVADASGDGINDLVACLAFESNMAVAHGLPGGGVGPVDLLDASGFPLRPFVADNDGNGAADLFALSGNGNRVNLWLADGAGKLLGARNYDSVLTDARFVASADFDGDGDFEAVVGGNAPGLSLMGRDGSGLEVDGLVPVGADVRQIEVADLGGDGRPDLLLAVPGGLRLFRNESTPGLYSFVDQVSANFDLGSATTPSSIEIADVNGDGNDDLVVCDPATDTVFVLAGTSDAFAFGPAVAIDVAGGPIDAVAGDYNGDGLVDLAVARSTLADVAILQNDDNLGFNEVMLVPVGLVGQTPTSLLGDDFNGDGLTDLVISNTGSDTVSLLLANGGGFVGQEVAVGESPVALLARDLSNDGVPDLLVASLEGGDFRVLIGSRDGSFASETVYPGTLATFDATLADMTGNGQADLVITNLLTNRVTLVDNITTQ